MGIFIGSAVFLNIQRNPARACVACSTVKCRSGGIRRITGNNYRKIARRYRPCRIIPPVYSDTRTLKFGQVIYMFIY
ncbi:MAG: hypothetical protein LKM40_02465 [Mageeibacillus sp.]|nr:hypothetical protein [Mageeibacillus sp.]